MSHSDKDQSQRPKSRQSSQPKRRRGRPEKPLKIDDTPRNVARTFFGIKSSKYVRPE